MDATLIAAPCSTKNQAEARDPERHPARKGNPWYFGAKAHVGADAESGVVHSLTGTAANVADVTETANGLHGNEEHVHADAGDTGAEKREELKDGVVRWHIAAKRSRVVAEDESQHPLTREIETIQARIRARVGQAFPVLKKLFGYRQCRYRGLAKSGPRWRRCSPW